MALFSAAQSVLGLCWVSSTPLEPRTDSVKGSNAPSSYCTKSEHVEKVFFLFVFLYNTKICFFMCFFPFPSTEWRSLKEKCHGKMPPKILRREKKRRVASPTLARFTGSQRGSRAEVVARPISQSGCSPWSEYTCGEENRVSDQTHLTPSQQSALCHETSRAILHALHLTVLHASRLLQPTTNISHKIHPQCLRL